MRDFCNGREFTIALNYHSYANVNIFSWGYDTVHCEDHDVLLALGRLRRSLGAAAGAVIVPIIGMAIFGFSMMLLAVLIPIGIVIGLLAGFMGAPLMFGHSGHRAGRGGFWIGGGGGLGGGFGGFSGGCGGFGGGGASGGW